MSKVDSFPKRDYETSEFMSVGISAFLKDQTEKTLKLHPNSSALL